MREQLDSERIHISSSSAGTSGVLEGMAAAPSSTPVNEAEAAQSSPSENEAEREFQNFIL